MTTFNCTLVIFAIIFSLFTMCIFPLILAKWEEKIIEKRAEQRRKEKEKWLASTDAEIHEKLH
jgi:hypothetical protein